MDTGFVAVPACAACGEPSSARVELIAPRQLPAEWQEWTARDREHFLGRRDQAQWWLPFAGVDAGNGGGDAVSLSGYGRCPRGHGKSLDPHWSPDY